MKKKHGSSCRYDNVYLELKVKVDINHMELAYMYAFNIWLKLRSVETLSFLLFQYLYLVICL